METPTACTSGRCMRWRGLAIGRDEGSVKGQLLSPETDLNNDSQCQRRTCGINLEPMQCRVRGRQSLTEWEASSETGRIPGAKSVRQAQQGARTKEASCKELAAHNNLVELSGLTVGLLYTVQAGLPRHITHTSLSTARVRFGRSIPSAVRSIDFPMWALHSTRRPLPTSLMTRWQAPRDDYTRSLEKQAAFPASSPVMIEPR